MRPDWEDTKISVMAGVVWSKFYINEHLRSLLLNTGERQLIEANHWNDRFWGVDAETGCGLNWLGKTLMITREYFRRLHTVHIDNAVNNAS